MDNKYYLEYLDFEKNNPWYIARRELIIKLLRDRKDKIIFDLGAGSGFIVSFLKKKGFKKVFGAEYSKDFINYEKPFILNSPLNHLPLKDGSADVVLCLDVLEHLKNDKGAIKEISRILKKGGIAIITVPALKLLWSVHDEINNHFRRYEKKELNRLLKKEFRIIKQTYWNFFLFLPIALMKFYKRKDSSNKRKHDFQEKGTIVNFISLSLFRLENWLVRNGISFPFGVSLVTVVKSEK